MENKYNFSAAQIFVKLCAAYIDYQNEEFLRYAYFLYGEHNVKKWMNDENPQKLINAMLEGLKIFADADTTAATFTQTLENLFANGTFTENGKVILLDCKNLEDMYELISSKMGVSPAVVGHCMDVAQKHKCLLNEISHKLEE